MPKNRIIGVFDSGIGGLSVAKAVEAALPQHTVLFRNDAKNVPYGNRPPAEILPLILPIFQSLIDDGCDVIVVACNTVSTTLIGPLRESFGVPFIAMEPMVKPSAQLSTSKVIAICATPTTLASRRYAELKQQFAKDLTVIEPDCSEWSTLIERSQLNHETIAQQLAPALAAGADVIVLGCTHYHWIENEIQDIVAGKAVVLQPEPAVISQLIRVIARLP
ncbi:glutamate racemase [Polaromonas sp.]|nr:glutamate racemase [Candidatus Saccharibacteria bacterium]